MNIGQLIYSLTQMEEINESNLQDYVASQVACNEIKDFIRLISPDNIHEMEEMFDTVFGMIQSSKVNLNDEMAKDIIISVLKKVESLEKKLCPEFSDKEFNFDKLSTKDTIITIAQKYIGFVESIYMSFNAYLKDISKGYYIIKKEILRKSLNSVEDICLI